MLRPSAVSFREAAEFVSRVGALSAMAEVAERVEAAGPFDGLRDLSTVRS